MKLNTTLTNSTGMYLHVLSYANDQYSPGFTHEYMYVCLHAKWRQTVEIVECQPGRAATCTLTLLFWHENHQRTQMQMQAECPRPAASPSAQTLQ
jgi:hypothetical protein